MRMNFNLSPEDTRFDSDIEQTIAPLKRYKFAVPHASLRRSNCYRGNWQHDVLSYRDPTYYMAAASYVSRLNNVTVSQAIEKAKAKFSRRYRRLAIQFIMEKAQGEHFHFEDIHPERHVDVIDNVIIRSRELSKKEENKLELKEKLQIEKDFKVYKVNHPTDKNPIIVCRSKLGIWFELTLQYDWFGYYNYMYYNPHHEIFHRHIKQYIFDKHSIISQQRSMTSHEIKMFKYTYGVTEV